MRLGLIGTGKQGQRYLLEKNGGAHIKVSGSRRIPLDDVDGVIIATHPAGHKELALEAIAAGKHVLIEKPLALNLRDCIGIIDAAEKSGLHLEVAHTHLWSETFQTLVGGVLYQPAYGYVEYTSHDRDYSPWLDWAPHILSMLAHLGPHLAPRALEAQCSVMRGDRRRVRVVRGSDGETPAVYTGKEIIKGVNEPMFNMVESFVRLGSPAPHRLRKNTYDFNRRVYRALFAED